MNCYNCKKSTKNNKFCSRSCSVSYSNRENPKVKKTGHVCSYCKNIYFNKTNKNQKYCSIKCRYAYKYHLAELNIQQITNPKTIRKYLISKNGNFCNICNISAENWNGSNLVLIVDHIDGKADNNDLRNLRLVCPNCDSQLSTFKGRNKGKSSRSYTITQKVRRDGIEPS